jgi:hypothetical protein
VITTAITTAKLEERELYVYLFLQAERKQLQLLKQPNFLLN